MYFEEKEFIKRLENQKKRNQEEMLAEELQRVKNTIRNFPLFLRHLRRLKELEWINHRLRMKRKRRKKLFETFLELECQKREQEEKMLEEELEAKRAENAHKKTLAKEMLEVYLAHRPKV